MQCLGHGSTKRTPIPCTALRPVQTETKWNRNLTTKLTFYVPCLHQDGLVFSSYFFFLLVLGVMVILSSTFVIQDF